MTFSGDDENIPRSELGNRRADRLGAVADLARIGGRGEDGGADRRGVLGAWIVVGDDDGVGLLAGDGAHHRPLARIAVAARADDDEEPPGGIGPQGVEHMGERIGLVRIVDDDERAVDLGHPLEAPLDAGNAGKPVDDVLHRAAGSEGEPGRDDGVRRLEVAGERQQHLVEMAFMRQLEALREALARNVGDGDVAAGPADADEVEPPRLGNRLDPRGLRRVGIDDGDRPFGQEALEEPELGREIGLDGRVIVEVVAAEIGEGGSREAHAVEPPLVEPVRGRLHGKVRHALAGEAVERLVQGDRIRRGQRAVVGTRRRDHADGAEARRLVAAGREELAREFGDGALAARARDGDDRAGLAGKDPRCGQRQRPAGVDDGAEDHLPRKVLGPASLRHHGGGAARQRIRDIAPAVLARARERDEDVARLHLARIEGNAAHAHGCMERSGEGIGQDVAQCKTVGACSVRHWMPQAPACAMAGNGRYGFSNRGGRPSSGATRSITLPVVTPAFQAAVE